MIGRTHDLMRDPLNRSWDAVVSSAPVPQTATGQTEHAMLQQFHKLDAAPAPDPGFVERLAQQLGAFEQAQMCSQLDPAPPVAPKPRSNSRPPEHPIAIERRWITAMAAALAILLGGILFIWLASTSNDPEERIIPAAVVPAIPGTPASDGPVANRLLSTTFDPASIGATGQDEWTVALEYLLDVPTGETYRQNGPENGDIGISVEVVTIGSFDAISTGPTLLYRAGDTNSQDVAPNTPLSLTVGDAWITSMADLVTATNTSGDPAEILRYAVGKPGAAVGIPSALDTYFEFTPDGESGGYPFAQDPKLPAWPDGPVTIDLQRVPLEKGASYGVEVHPDESFLLVTSGTGAVRVTKDGSNRGASSIATSLGDYPPGAYTINRDLSGTVDVYLARWTSATTASPAGTPAADTPEIEALLDATFDPAALGTDATQSWKMISDYIIDLEPGETLSIGGEQFDGGFFVTFPLSGSVEITTSRDALWSDRIGAELQPLAPGATQEIAPGQVWAGAAATPGEIANRTDQTATLFIHSLGSSVSEVAGGVAIGPDRLARVGTEDPDNHLVYAGEPVTVSVERVTLDHAEHYDFDLSPNEAVLLRTGDSSPVRVTSVQDQIDTVSFQRALHGTATTQTYTVTRDLQEPVKVYLIRVSAPNADEAGAVAP